MNKSNEIGDFYLKHISIEEVERYYREAYRISSLILEKRKDSIEAKTDIKISIGSKRNCNY